MMLLLSFALAKPMTLDQALTLAEEANPEISGASYDLQAAEARATAARGTFDPYFSLEAGRGFNVSEGSFGGFETHTETTSVLWNATLGQTLPTGTSWSMNTSNSSSLVDLNILDLGVEGGEDGRCCRGRRLRGRRALGFRFYLGLIFGVGVGVALVRLGQDRRHIDVGDHGDLGAILRECGICFAGSR